MSLEILHAFRRFRFQYSSLWSCNIAQQNQYNCHSYAVGVDLMFITGICVSHFDAPLSLEVPIPFTAAWKRTPICDA